MHKKFSLISILLSCFILLPVCAVAIPTLGVAPGSPTDPSTWNLSYDGFPMPLTGGELTIWYGSDSGNINYVPGTNDLWLLTTSAAGDTFKFNGIDFVSANLSVASYKDPVYGVNLTDDIFEFKTGDWTQFQSGDTFYNYEFGTGQKDFWYLTGILDVSGGSGLEIGDWMYAVLEGNSVDGFSPQTTSSMATPEPASMLLLGSGLLGLAGLGRKKFFKNKKG